jgi:Bacteriophage baseplate protein W
MIAKDFLGTGWAFPVGVDARGRIALARQEQDIEQSIRMIVLTPKGQRVMRPEFGCHIHELIFAPNNAGTAGLAAKYVEDAVGMWEPRVSVSEVKAVRDASNPACLLIEVVYDVKSTNDRRSLVFPFYTVPDE